MNHHYQENSSQEKADRSLYYNPAFSWSFLKPKYWGVWLLITVVFILAWLPRRWSLAVGSAIGMGLYKLNEKRKLITQTNLKLCFPDKTDEERHQLMKDSYKSYGQNIIDMGYIWWSSVKRLEKNMDLTGFEHFAKARDEGKPILLLTPHATGMDQCGILLSIYHHTGISMMKSLKNPLLDWIITKGRMRFLTKNKISGMFVREAGIRQLVRVMKKHKAMCYYIPDEDLGIDNSIFVPFFGVQAATIPMLGRMAKLSGAVVLPTMAEITDEGRHHIHVLPPLENFPSGDDYQDTLMMNEALEKLVLISPKQYMWTQKWFKTRPNGEPTPYVK